MRYLLLLLALSGCGTTTHERGLSGGVVMPFCVFACRVVIQQGFAAEHSTVTTETSRAVELGFTQPEAEPEEVPQVFH